MLDHSQGQKIQKSQPETSKKPTSTIVPNSVGCVPFYSSHFPPVKKQLTYHNFTEKNFLYSRPLVQWHACYRTNPRIAWVF